MFVLVSFISAFFFAHFVEYSIYAFPPKGKKEEGICL